MFARTINGDDNGFSVSSARKVQPQAVIHPSIFDHLKIKCFAIYVVKPATEKLDKNIGPIYL